MSNTSKPPPPPPLPQPTAKPTPSTLKLRSNISPFIHKLQQAPHGHRSNPQDRPPPRVGPYFFYGTLTAPSLLSEILRLPAPPYLRPAKIINYSLKLWGQYPALVDGPAGAVVEGMVYDVEDVGQAGRLAQYETRAYCVAECWIFFTDGGKPEEVVGSVFRYAGDPGDVGEGTFDLETWLRRMGRGGKEGDGVVVDGQVSQAAEGKEDHKFGEAPPAASPMKQYGARPTTVTS